MSHARDQILLRQMENYWANHRTWSKSSVVPNVDGMLKRWRSVEGIAVRGRLLGLLFTVRHSNHTLRQVLHTLTVLPLAA